jgi:hypothetical protein
MYASGTGIEHVAIVGTNLTHALTRVLASFGGGSGLAIAAPERMSPGL